MPEPADRLADLRRDLDAAAGRGAGRHGAPPRLFTLPESLRSAVVRVKPSALIGAAVLLVLVLAIVGVRAAWAERAAEPVPVATTRSGSVGVADPAGQTAVNAGDSEPATSPGESTLAAQEPEIAATASGVPAAEPVALLYVHVIGAVREPGVVEVPAGARVSDVVEAAGGLSGTANLSLINLARVVVDAERIWIPVEGEELPVEVADSSPTVSSTPGAIPETTTGDGTGVGEAAPAQIDLNTADSTALQTLPGVGPVTAESILTWRTENGRFNTIDELLEVSGIGPRTLDKLRPRVIVGGP